MSDRVVITGGAGFIGSHLAEYLCNQGTHVVLIDNLSTGLRSNVEPLLGPRCELIVGDAGQVVQDRQVMAGVTQVYHLAAAVGVRLITDDPSGMIHNNVEQSRFVIEAALRNHAQLLVASSSEVYGKCPVSPLREDMDLVFGPTSASRWSYGLSKAIDEHLTLDLAKRAGLRGVVVRLFNTIGPRQRGKYGMVVPRFVRQAVSNEPLQIYDDGQQTRSFCDVRDVVRAMPKLLADEQCHGRVFNLGSDQPMTIDALADHVLALSGSSAGKAHVPYQTVYGAGFEDPRFRQPDVSAIRDAIGFEPTITLTQTLTDLITLAKGETSAPACAGKEQD